MKCSIEGCPGQYEEKTILHTVEKNGQIAVFEKVPAEICNVCSDVLLAPDTVRHLEVMLTEVGRPERMAPVYAYH